MTTPNVNIATGILCGTLLSINIDLDDIVKTVLLAGIGASVSCLVSFMLNRWIRSKKGKK